MMQLYRLLSLRYLWHRWDRAALIIASIALGVATLVSSRLLNQVIERAAGQTSTPLGMGDLFIGNGEFGVPRSMVDELRTASIPGVSAVQPLVLERVVLPQVENRNAVLIGVELSTEWLDPGKANPLGVTFTKTLEENRTTAILLFTRRIIVVSKPAYDDWLRTRADASAPFVVRLGNRTIDCLPAGYFEAKPDSPVGLLGTHVVGMEIVQSSRFVRPGPSPTLGALAGGVASEEVWEKLNPLRVNRIDVLYEPTADVISVRSAVEAIVQNRAQVQTPDMQGQSTQEIISGIQIGFTLCSLAAMVVGLFLVYNALAVTVAERRHDIGILRSIGATRFQVVLLFAVSAFVLGLLGAVIGVPAGTLMAHVILETFREELGAMFLNPNAAPAIPTLWTVLLAMLAGIGTAVFAALIPAIQAAYQDPADAVRRIPGVAGGVWAMAHKATCATLIAGGIIMIITRHELPPRVGAFGGMMAALIGMLLSAPILVGLMVRMLHPILRWVLPIEARLAADNLIRSPGRTGVVIGALGAGVAVMIQTAGVGLSNEVPVVQWLDEVIQADRFVFAGSVTEATSSQAPLDPKVIDDLRKIPNVDSAVGIRYVRPDFNNTVVFLVAIDAVDYAENTAKRTPANREGLEKLRALPGANFAIVSENFAQRHNLFPGDSLRLPGPRGPVELRIVDTVRDYSWSRGTIFLDRKVYATLFQDPLVDICHVYLKDAKAESVESLAVTEYASAHSLTVQDRKTVRRFLADLIDRVYVLAFLQQIVVGIVAALGVVTALLISVLQRKRELGLLMAVGATPAQIVRTVLAEALLIGFFGTVLGIMIGLPMEWYILHVVLFEESGFVFDLLVPWRQGLGIAVGAIFVSAIAGLIPAIHAIRLRIPDAIAHE